MDISSSHSDPLRDAVQDAVYRAVQVGSFAMTSAQMYAYHRRAQARITAEQDHRARRALNAQVRAERDADRTRWAPPSTLPGSAMPVSSRPRTRGVRPCPTPTATCPGTSQPLLPP